MANRVKASGICTIRQILQKESLTAKVMERLSPETQSLFNKTVTNDWILFPAEAEIFTTAAQALYPSDPNRLHRLGHAVADIQFKGIYQIFLAIATVEFVIKRAAQIWNMIYDSGSVHLENLGPTGGTLVVSDLEEQLPVQREYICGFLTALLEMTNVKDIRVSKDERDPKAWKWMFTWRRK